MIIAMRRTPYEDLRDSLDKKSKLVVLACNNCPRKYGLAGRVGLNALADKLENDGFDVIRRELVGFACAVDLVAKRAKDPATKKWFEEADIILPLACEHGEAAVRVAFPGKKVPAVSKTVGIGWGAPGVGIRLTHCVHGVDLNIDDPQGIPLDEAAKRLGLQAGSF